MHVLLVEDDETVGRFIVEQLQQAGHECTWKVDGVSGLAAARSDSFDVIVVDRMLPGTDGLTLLATLRNAGLTTPVLVLSALGEVSDRVEGLQSGADDYLVKPFSIDELLARLDVLFRRVASESSAAQTELTVADLRIDLLSREVTRAGQPISVQPREFKLLEYLMRHAAQLVTRAMLLEHVWGYHFAPQTNVIDVHISRLRQKIDKGFPEPLLETVRGAGYRLGDAPVDAQPGTSTDSVSQ